MPYDLGKCLYHTFRQDFKIIWKRSFGSTRDVTESKALLDPSRGVTRTESATKRAWLAMRKKCDVAGALPEPLGSTPLLPRPPGRTQRTDVTMESTREREWEAG